MSKSFKIYLNIKSDGNSVNIDAIDMRHIPFESSRRDDSNDTKFIEIQSLDAEIIAKTVFDFMLHKITMYYVNEVLYNEVPFGPDVGFVISRVDCNLAGVVSAK